MCCSRFGGLFTWSLTPVPADRQRLRVGFAAVVAGLCDLVWTPKQSLLALWISSCEACMEACNSPWSECARACAGCSCIGTAVVEQFDQQACAVQYGAGAGMQAVNACLQSSGTCPHSAAPRTLVLYVVQPLDVLCSAAQACGLPSRTVTQSLISADAAAGACSSVQSASDLIHPCDCGLQCGTGPGT